MTCAHCAALLLVAGAARAQQPAETADPAPTAEDFGANQAVRNRLARYKVMSGRFIDVARYDCVNDDNCDAM